MSDLRIVLLSLFHVQLGTFLHESTDKPTKEPIDFLWLMATYSALMLSGFERQQTPPETRLTVGNRALALYYYVPGLPPKVVMLHGCAASKKDFALHHLLDVIL